MARVYGHSAFMYLKRAATSGATPTGNFLQMPFYTSSLGGSQSPEANDLAGQGRDPQAPVYGPLDVGGNVQVPLDPRYFGHWLTGLLGNPVTTADEDVYTHVFKSGKTSLPDYGVEIAMPQGSIYALNTGVMVNGLSLKMERSGVLKVGLDLLGQNEVISGATSAGTPQKLTPADPAQMNHFQGVLKMGGERIGNVGSFDLNFSNGLIVVDAANNQGVLEGVDPGPVSLSCNLEVKLSDLSFHEAAMERTPVSLDLTYSISESLKLQMEFHQLYLARAPLAVNGPGGVNANYAMTGARNATAGASMTATLINDQAGTVYVPA